MSNKTQREALDSQLIQLEEALGQPGRVEPEQAKSQEELPPEIGEPGEPEAQESHPAPAIDEPPPSPMGPSFDARIQEPEPVDGFFDLMEMLLKDRERLFALLRDEKGISQMIPGLLFLTLLGLVVVGAILGTYTGGWQILYVACKLPLLFLLTLAVCHCSFWVWNIYFRARMGSGQVAALTLSSIATTSLLLLGLSPLLWLALGGGIEQLSKLPLATQEAHYHRAILVLVASFGVAGLGGLHVLYQGLQAIAQPAEGPQRRWGGTRTMAAVWIGLYGFVGLQMSWILRPYLFHPWANGRPLTFLRQLDGNVYESVIKILLSVLGYMGL